MRLGQRISLDRSTMADVVSRLSARGLIATERDARDGRRKVISLSPKGLHALQQLIPRTHVMSGRLVGSLSVAHQEELMGLLTELIKAHEKSVAPIKAELKPRRRAAARVSPRRPG